MACNCFRALESINVNRETAVKQIKELGYCLLPELLSPEECDRYRELLNRIAETYSPLYHVAGDRSKHGLDDKEQEKVVFNVHNKSYDFYRIFGHPKVIEIVDPLLREGSYGNKDPYYLYINTARSPHKGCQPQQLHLDCRIPGSKFPLAVIAIWMIDDFTRESGATRVVPRSHLSGEFAEDGKIYNEEILITAKRGSVLVFDASLWHGGSAKETVEDRWGLIVGYQRWFLKPAFDYHRNTPREIYDQMTEGEKELLGFKLHAPVDEFTRLRRIAQECEEPAPYELPVKM